MRTKGLAQREFGGRRPCRNRLEVASRQDSARNAAGSLEIWHVRIYNLVGCDEIEAFEDRAFDRIIHDPPTFSLAGELYSAQFYGQLRRVLKRKGRLFHYIGDLESRSGRNVVKGAVGRLKEAGFARVVRRPAAYGVVAYG